MSSPPSRPPFLLLFAAGFGGAVYWHGRGNWRELSLCWLVGFQAFRIVVELLIHLAVIEGVAPEQLTWTGLNFGLNARRSARSRSSRPQRTSGSFFRFSPSTTQPRVAE